jgi:hypothetical protein
VQHQAQVRAGQAGAGQRAPGGEDGGLGWREVGDRQAAGAELGQVVRADQALGDGLLGGRVLLWVCGYQADTARMPMP